MNIDRSKKFITIDGKKVPLIYGNKGGCFAAGTLIDTPTGRVPIENIKAGDIVDCFDSTGVVATGVVTELFVHPCQEVIKVWFWGHQYLLVTPNHWVLTEYNNFIEVGRLQIDDALITRNNFVCPIEKIETVTSKTTTYNFTVDNYHTYFANGVKVHNKGGGKGGGVAAPGVEDPNTLFSTDILFLTVALGEGPVYRINPNGAQDIELNEGSIDDVLNLDGDGLINTEFFKIDNRTGTLDQTIMPVFGEEVIVPQNMAGPVFLKKGNVPGVPRSAVSLQDTSVGRFDSLRFLFNLNALQKLDDQGNIFGFETIVKVTIFNRTGETVIVESSNTAGTISGKTNIPFRTTIDIPIPTEFLSDSGYKFTVEKISDDSDSSKIQDAISFIGWLEVQNEAHAYPRTALIGYALKAFGQYTGGVPSFTNLTKGIICKVPSNYNQPILSNGEIDWRELELPETGTNGYTVNGYRLQKSGDTVKTDLNPILYDGLWDGTFAFSWTQNPVWVLYDLLTNREYGLGIQEENIDKFKFFKVAQYCDAVDPITGQFIGVDGISDGTFRHKPRTTFTSVRDTLVGINSGIKIKERRFTIDITIAAQKQVLDIINIVAGLFRGVVFYAGGKISLNVDIPEDVPVAIFNEANIEKNSLQISGIKETEILTGVDVTYIEPSNHYRREVVRIDDPEALKEATQIQNVKEVDLQGVTRRSQAIRFGQYLLASSKFIRRKVVFKTSTEALNITVGDVIAVSQRVPGTAWGYGGRVSGNSVVGQSNVVLEHYTSPSISNTVITGNTLPLGLRVIKRNSDRVDLFMLSNSSFNAINTSNTITGTDLLEFTIIGTMNITNKTFLFGGANAQFQSNNVPTRGDVWTFGEVNPTAFYESQNDKLFKVTGLERDENEIITVSAAEYVSNVYVDSDTLISYEPTLYKDTISPFSTPPVPNLDVRSLLTRQPDGSVRNDLEVFVNYDTGSYPLNLGIEIEYAFAGISQEIESIL